MHGKCVGPAGVSQFEITNQVSAKTAVQYFLGIHVFEKIQQWKFCRQRIFILVEFFIELGKRVVVLEIPVLVDAVDQRAV